MLKKTTLLLFSACSVIAVSACKQIPHSPQPEPTAYSMEATTKQCENLVASVGNDFQISLVENPTTGYSWQLAQQPKLVKLVSKDYRPPQTDRPGSPGVAIFTFSPLSKGGEELQFVYQRPWEKDNASDTFRCTITINE